MKRLVALMACLISSAAPATSGGGSTALTPGYYSNLIGSDDVEGVELKVSKRGSSYRATYMYAEGGCGDLVSSSLTLDRTGWRFDGVWRDGDLTTPVHFWLRAERKGLRLLPGAGTNWIAQPNGDLLRRVRYPVCVK